MMNYPEASQFNIHSGNEFTQNVQPILHEIRHALQRLVNDGEASVIDLRSIPLAPGEEESIINTLGQGEVFARLDALGPSEIYETRYTGVWMVTHFNESQSIVSRFIEIIEIPEVLKSQHQDMVSAITALQSDLLTGDT
jgi:hydrogenase-1 operon protein HyaF